ncbi:MAG TPA: ribosome silencing factor [Egibacteraceae bacterium]|nr:ribosome silencing factor [Egibacteraceae bacterium]
MRRRRQSRSEPLSTVDTTQSRERALAAAQAAADKKATDIRILDLGELLGITDYFVIVTAGNERQLGTVADEVQARLKGGGASPRRREGGKETGWMLLDYGDVVVHAFTPEQRSYYELERLWSDAPKVEFSPAPEAAIAD